MSYCENRNRIPWIGLVLGFALSLALLQPSLQAQARLVAAVSRAPAVAENNRAARAGDLLFFVTTGTTDPDGIVLIDYGLPIKVVGRVSGLEGAAIEEVDAEAGIVSLRIPEGMTSDDSLRLEGFRFDMTASETRSVVANLSVSGGSGFFIRPENVSVVVISDVLPGLKVRSQVGRRLFHSRNSVTSEPEELTLTIRESFPTAFSGFSGDTEYFNQNAATRLQVRIEDLPQRLGHLSRIDDLAHVGCDLHRAFRI